MKRTANRIIVACMMALAIFMLTSASAFVLSPGRPSENVSGAGARAPGLMVNAGVARHVSRLDDFESINEVTATAETEGRFGQILPLAIASIFDELNTALDALITALFVRAGETPPALNQAQNTAARQTVSKQTARQSLTDRSIDRVDQTRR